MQPEIQSKERPAVGAWFVSANPEQYLWKTAFAEGQVDWEGARSPLAQRNIRLCLPGDPVIAYQSSPQRQVVGLGRIDRVPERFEEDGREWFKVGIRTEKLFPQPINMSEIAAAVPDLEHLKTVRPSFTTVTPAQWEQLQGLFKAPPPSSSMAIAEEGAEAVAPSDQEGEGVLFSEYAKLDCTPVVRAVLDECISIAQEEGYQRWISGGVLLCACEQVGRNTPRRSDWNAVRWLAEAMDPGAFASVRANYFERHRRRKSGPLPARAFGFVSTHFAEIVHEARRLAGKVEVGARHLVVALLSVGDPARAPSSWRLLYAAGGDRHRLVRDLLDGLIDSGYPEEVAWWTAERRRLVQTGSVIAGFSADNPLGEDCLNLEADVNAMASLMVARAVEPPLAIGIFGEWGSGKSFFLRRLREAIKRTTASGDPSYWPNVVPIEFNAWHYVDANLWASLTAHILQQLSCRTHPEVSDPAQQEACRAALELLQLTDERLQKATKKEADLRSDLTMAESKTASAIKQIKEDEFALADQVARNLLAEIDVAGAVKAVAGAESSLAELAKIDSAYQDVLASGKDLHDRLENLGRSGTRLELLLGALRKGQGFWPKTLPWFGAAAVVLVGLWLFKDRPFFQDLVGRLLGFLTTAATALMGVATWVSGQHKRIVGLLEPLEKARQAVDARIAAAETERQQAIAQLQGQLAVKHAELNQAVVEKTKAADAVALARQAARDTVSGRMIDAFVAERVGSGEYQKHLGLVAVVRNDFEKLSHMIRTHNSIQDGTQEEEVVAALRAKGVEIANLGLNRIVLYIDDLDRCPPRYVVDVLQAIHLLLAFPVFVVVVAVDSRWMKRALLQEYPLLVGGSGSNGREAAGKGAPSLAQAHASPEDYLEKIFQIPYWLQPMTPTASSRLMKSLAGVTDGRRSPRSATAGAPPGGARTEERSAEPAANEEGSANPGTKDEGSKPPADHAEEGETPYREKPPLPSAERLRLGAKESSGMEELALLVGRSPRAAKRFVNTYRVIRASLSEAQLEQMERQRGFDSILFLLALGTGAPSMLPEFESRLREATNPRVSVVTLLGATAAARQENAPAETGREAAKRVRQWVESAGSRWTSLTRQRVEPWVSRVRQFSFFGETESLAEPAGKKTGQNPTG